MPPELDEMRKAVRAAMSRDGADPDRDGRPVVEQVVCSYAVGELDS